MEQYLIDDYDVIESKYLTDESDIEEYFSDIAREYLDCGQGYYEDQATFLCKTGDTFYEVEVLADIGSAKQDIGDRLYWVERVSSVRYKEIPKPQPKSKETVTYTLQVTEGQKKSLEEFLSTNAIKNEK